MPRVRPFDSRPPGVEWDDAATKHGRAGVFHGDESLLLHGSKSWAGAFIPGFQAQRGWGHGLLYFADPLRCHRAEQQARTFAGSTGVVLHVRLRGGKRFDPLNDPAAAAIAREWLAPRDFWGWSVARLPYEAAHEIVERATPHGYEVFEFYESAWHSWSVAVLEDAASRLLTVERVEPMRGRAARERAVVPSFRATDLYVHPYVSPRQRRLTDGEKAVRRVAIALKTAAGARRASAVAAPAMAALVGRPDAFLIPVPDSRGSTATNLVLAQAIAAELPGAVAVDGLVRGSRVRSSRARRRLGLRGLHPEEHGMGWTGPAWVLGAVDRVYLVDNVIVTGGTLEASRCALGGGTGLAWARQALGG